MQMSTQSRVPLRRGGRGVAFESLHWLVRHQAIFCRFHSNDRRVCRH